MYVNLSMCIGVFVVDKASICHANRYFCTATYHLGRSLGILMHASLAALSFLIILKVKLTDSCIYLYTKYTNTYRISLHDFRIALLSILRPHIVMIIEA